MVCAGGRLSTWEESSESQAGVHYRFPTQWETLGNFPASRCSSVDHPSGNQVAANSSQLPGRPLSCRVPLAAKDTPDPGTTSVTTRDTRISEELASPIMRAAALTAIPAMSSPRTSTSPVRRPARTLRPTDLAAPNRDKAHLIQRPGPSKLA